MTEVFENRPRFFLETTADGKVRYSFLGPTLGNRFLLVAIAPVDLEAGAWRLISAYWLRTNRALRRYERTET